MPLRDGQGTPLFCLHPVGGHVGFYRPLAARLDGIGPVFGLQAPELAGLDAAGSVEALARWHAEAIRRVQAHGPYRLLGWSTGGLLALAVARELRAHGGEVEYLGLIDARSTFTEDLPADERLTAEATWLELRGTGHTLQAGQAGADATPIGAWLALDFAQAADTAAHWGLQPALSEQTFEHLRAQVPVTRDHLRLFARHQPQPLDVPLQVFHSAGVHAAGRPPAMWPQARQTVPVEADHYALLAPPHVDAIAGAIVALLGEADRGAATADAAHQSEGAPA